MRKLGIIIILLFVGTSFAFSQQKSAGGNTTRLKSKGSTDGWTIITSKSLEFDYKRSIAEFDENVVVRDSRIQIETDHLNVIFDGSNSVQSVTAIGNVKIRRGASEGSCKRAIYYVEKGKIEMYGGAILSRPSEALKADEIKFEVEVGADVNDISSVSASGNVQLFSRGDIADKKEIPKGKSSDVKR